MGRNLKQGIDYFLVNVKYLENCKVDKLNNEVGIKGIAILHFFYSLIYYHGYYIEFENNDYLIRLINKYFYHDNFKKLELKDIIDSLLDCSLFDNALFNQSILTSKEIQAHYYEVTRKRKERDFSLYWLLTKEEMDEIDRHSNFKKSEFISTDENIIFTSENKVFADDNSISTSDGTTSKSNSKRKRDKKDKYDKSNSGEFPSLNYFTKLLIKHNYIDEYDLDILNFNTLFKELLNQYDYELVLSGINYLIKYSRHNSVPIDDKFDFFKSSIINNLNNLERRNNDDTNNDWLKDFINSCSK